MTTVPGSRYPVPFDAPCAARLRRCLGDAAGLTDFGVNLMTLPPGAWSSQRHWHAAEVGSRRPLEDAVVYSDIDLRVPQGRDIYVHANGELYPEFKPRLPGT